MKASKRALAMTRIIPILAIVGIILIIMQISNSKYYYKSFRESLDKPYKLSHLEVIREVPTKSKTIAILLNEKSKDIQLCKYKQNRSGTKFKCTGETTLISYNSSRKEYYFEFEENDCVKVLEYPDMFFGVVSAENRENLRVDAKKPSFIDIDIDGKQFTLWYVENVKTKTVDISFKS